VDPECALLFLSILLRLHVGCDRVRVWVLLYQEILFEMRYRHEFKIHSSTMQNTTQTNPALSACSAVEHQNTLLYHTPPRRIYPRKAIPHVIRSNNLYRNLSLEVVCNRLPIQNALVGFSDMGLHRLASPSFIQCFDWISFNGGWRLPDGETEGYYCRP